MTEIQGTRSLLSIADLDPATLRYLVDRSAELAADPAAHNFPLHGLAVGILFAKSSTRTRTAFTVGCLRLGGYPVPYGPHDLQTSTGETMADTGRILASMLNVLVARTAGPRQDLEALSAGGRLPVVNAMSADEHPTQAISDLATMRRHFGAVDGLRVLYAGEGNSSAVALAYALALSADCHLMLATPAGYGVPPPLLDYAAGLASKNGGTVRQVHDLRDASGPFDVVYTTQWQTTGAASKEPGWRRAFGPFQVNERLLGRWPGAAFMHDLPAHRGEEVTGAVLDGNRSIAWTQAATKLPAAMAVLEWTAGSARTCDDGGTTW